MEWEAFVKRTRARLGVKPTITRAEPLAPRVKKYELVKVEHGRRRVIAWNVTIDEAAALKKAAIKRMTKLDEPNDSGGPLFEITEIKVETMD
jgi:hypothetical protein